ncbi:MAG: hypothetical protein ACI8QZ_002895 [Chlamydiales bacterium]|jgi:hypothetical protein
MTTPAAEITAPGEQLFNEPESTARGLRIARRWARLPDFLMIASIVTLVVLTSLPRLRAFVVRSNELDACDTLARLVVLDLEHGNFADVMAASPGLRRRLQDGVVTGDGELLRFHGFCFVITRPDADPNGAWSLLAWPELFGQSGVRAYSASSKGELWVHPNANGRWSGPELSPIGVAPGPASGWSPWAASSIASIQ